MLRFTCIEEMKPYFSEDIRMFYLGDDSFEEMQPYFSGGRGTFQFDDDVEILFDLETDATIAAHTIKAQRITAERIFARKIHAHTINANSLLQAREVQATNEVHALYCNCFDIYCDKFSFGRFLNPYINIYSTSGEALGVISNCGKGSRWDYFDSNPIKTVCNFIHYGKDKIEQCPICGCEIC